MPNDAPRWLESAVTIDVGGDRCCGVLTSPAERPVRPRGLVFLAGGEQYRAAAHRFHVLTARHLAALGHASLRFDVRGMGDSEGEGQGFEAQRDDIQAAITRMFEERPELRSVTLCGLCDGASAAALYAAQARDTRVDRLVLINPWVRHAQTLAATHLRQRFWAPLRDGRAWARLLRGDLGWSTVRTLARLLGQAWPTRAAGRSAGQDYRIEMLRGMARVPSTVLLSETDTTASEFLHFWQSTADQVGGAGERTELHPISQGDHTLSRDFMQRQAWDLMERALDRP